MISTAEKQIDNLSQFRLFKTGKTAWLWLFFAVFLFGLVPAKSLAYYVYEGIGFYAYSSQETGTVPIYRFYNREQGNHFYTASGGEKSTLINNPDWGYRYEGIGFYAYSGPTDGTVPVYRFYGVPQKDHFYTASGGEKSTLINNPDWGYRYEGIGFYAYSNQETGTVPVYRFNGKTQQDHFYTTSEGEKTVLINQGLGADISVGVWSYSKSGIQADPFRVEANKEYVIKDRDGELIATLAANTETKVTYHADGNLKIYGSIPDLIVDKEVTFESADGNNSDLILNANRPDSSYDLYRGKIKVRYGDTSKNIWIINILPLEQYVWGIGEITGTGDEDYNRVMTTAFRTYGYWKILYGTKYAIDGFKVDSTSASQIYRGYEWETAYPRVKQAAQYTQGKIAKYGSDIALSPYSSWTDGRTRSFKERWGSSAYPWCQSVPDPYGKHPTMTTSQLVAAGNHMVGISAHGALNLASDHNWAWDRILKYYLTGITITKIY